MRLIKMQDGSYVNWDAVTRVPVTLRLSTWSCPTTGCYRRAVSRLTHYSYVAWSADDPEIIIAVVSRSLTTCDRLAW